MDYFSKFLRPASGSSGTTSRPAHKPAPDVAHEFHLSWTVIKDTLTDPDESQLRRGIKSTVVPAQLQSMVDALVLESTRNEEGTTGVCLEYLLKNDVLGTLVRLSESDLPAGIQAEVLRAVQNMVVLLDEQFLVHSAVHRAVLRLLRNCVGDDLEEQIKLDGRRRVLGAAAAAREPSEYEEDLVNLLCILCSRIRNYRELLMIFFHDKHWYRSEPLFSVDEEDESLNEEDADEEAEYLANANLEESTTTATEAGAIAKKPEYEFLLFNYLLRFVHREGQIGDFARAGLLFLMDVAMSPSEIPSTSTSTLFTSSVPADPITDAALALAEYILDGDFSHVLGAGLGAVYSLLPSKLYFPAVGVNGDEDEEVKERLALENEKMLAMGVEDATSLDVRARVDHFLKMLEFLEDVVKRNNRGASENVNSTSLVGNAIVQSILDAVRTIFLENVFYPRILECSDADGSAVAVMAYLEVMVRTLGGTRLGEVLVEFLMSEDSEERAPPARMMKERKRSRRKSSAMTLLEMEAPETTNRPSGYFTSMGRFTLKDLLASNLRVGGGAEEQALQLLRSLLEEYPQMCVERMLAVVRDDKATEWPWPWVRDEEEEVFVYPGAAEEKEPQPIFEQPQTTYSTHEREMGLYLTLVSRVDPSHNADPFSTGYEHYLRDALVAIQAQGAGGYKHRLRVHGGDPMLDALLDSLRRFFSNDPKTNVALTGVLATLAMHPQRSLAGWLTFGVSEEEEKERSNAATITTGSSDGDGDDRSIDFSTSDALEKETVYLPATSIADESTKPVIHTIFHGLVAQLERYRHLVDDFDVYLGERRQGLLFSENLTDAMAVELGVAGEGIVPATAAATPVSGGKRPTVAASVVSFLTPKKSRGGVNTPPPVPKGEEEAVYASPFVRHYKKTGAITVESFMAPAPLGGGGGGGGGGLDLSMGWGDEEEDDPFIVDEKKEKKEEKKLVTLSHLLDNVVVLEESMKELVAIVHARRSLGIDGVRYL